MKRMKEDMKKRETKLNELLENTGYEIKYIEKVSNNTMLDGYMICEKKEGITSGPVIYYDPEWYDKSDLEVVSFLQSLWKRLPNINFEDIMKKEYICSHVMPMILDRSNLENMKKSTFVYVEKDAFLLLFYIDVPSLDNSMIKITHAILAEYNMTADELYQNALRNLDNDIEICSMNEILKEMCSDMVPDFENPMYVISNQKREYGAAAILCPSVYNRLSGILGSEFMILPSSIHECIAIPYNSDYEGLADMVTTINTSEVSDSDKLSDHVFLYDKNGLSVVA